MPTPTEFVIFALAGAFATNAIPHVVKGITGQRHQTPAGRDSSPVLNVLWGNTNVAIAGALLWWGKDAMALETVTVAFVVGVLVAVSLARHWADA